MFDANAALALRTVFGSRRPVSLFARGCGAESLDFTGLGRSMECRWLPVDLGHGSHDSGGSC
jgi:hypothetical protein